MTERSDFFVILFVDGIVRHGFYEDTPLRMSARAADTIRYGMVRDEGQSLEDAAHALIEAYEPEIRDRIHTARVGRITADDFVLVRVGAQ